MSIPFIHSHPISNISTAFKPNDWLSLSPEGSSMGLDSVDQFEQSLSSSDNYSASDSESQKESPGENKSYNNHSCSELEAFIFQEYCMPDLMAYGLPATQSVDQSFKLSVELPYPDLIPSLEGYQNKTSQTNQALNGQVSIAPPALSYRDNTGDWSGASSSKFPAQKVLSSLNSSPEISRNLIHTSELKELQVVSPLPHVSSQDYSTKNKLNLTVDTNMSAFKQNDKNLSSNYRDTLTPYSEFGNSSLSHSAPFFHGDSNDSTHHVDLGFQSRAVPSRPNVVDWLTSNIQYQHMITTAGGNFESLPTPSSATFSTLPTPTTANFSTSFSHPSFVKKSIVDIGSVPNSMPSLSNVELATSFGPVSQLGSKQINLQSNPTTVNFFDNHDFQSPECLNSKSHSIHSDISSIFGNLMPNQELCRQLRRTSLHSSNQSLTSGSPQPPKSTIDPHYLNHSTSTNQLSTKKRRSVDADFQKENIDPFHSRSNSSAILLLPHRTTTLGSRLKPGPKAKSTVVQHPPPTANLIGLNPSQEASGIPKDILKCLYETIVDSDKMDSDGNSISNRQYVCKLDGCGKAFPRKTAIESHIQTHLEDKPFVCHVKNCNAAFVRQHDLRRHQQIHSDNKPFSCICGKGFARGDALMRHRQRNICMGSFGPRRY